MFRSLFLLGLLATRAAAQSLTNMPETDAFLIDKVSHTAATGAALSTNQWGATDNAVVLTEFQVKIGIQDTVTFFDRHGASAAAAGKTELAAGQQVVAIHAPIGATDAACSEISRQICGGPLTLAASAAGNGFTAVVKCLGSKHTSTGDGLVEKMVTSGFANPIVSATAPMGRWCWRKSATSAWVLQKQAATYEVTALSGADTTIITAKVPGVDACVHKEKALGTDATSALAECSATTSTTLPTCITDGATLKTATPTAVTNMRFSTQVDAAAMIFPVNPPGWFLKKGTAVKVAIGKGASGTFVAGHVLKFVTGDDCGGTAITDEATIAGGDIAADGSNLVVTLTMNVDAAPTGNRLCWKAAGGNYALDTMAWATTDWVNTITTDTRSGNAATASPSPSPGAITTTSTAPAKAGESLLTVDKTSAAKFSAGNGIGIGASKTANDYEANTVSTVGTGSAYLNSFLSAAGSTTWNLGSPLKFDHPTGTLVTQTSTTASTKSDNWWDQWWDYWAKFGYNPFFFPWWGMWAPWHWGFFW